MTVVRIASIALAMAISLLVTGCRTAARAPAAVEPTPPGEAHADAIAKARADSVLRPYTEADIRFMSRMIEHHAQAIAMARMAPANGAGDAIRRLADRIINAQQDEIAIMQRWLRDRRQPVPDPDAPATAVHRGDHHPSMPGMVTPDQMRQLERARGPEFDRLFLTFMIQHHKGAITMVEELFGTYGAAQDQTVFKFASDANVDQSTEVARMSKMLADLLFQRPPSQPVPSGEPS